VEDKPLISDELAAFLESGLAIVVGTRDGALQPDGTGALAVRVERDRRHLTLFMFEDAGRAMLRNLESHPEIALDCDLPTSHRACQVKGTFVSCRPAELPERTIVDRQIEGFAADLETLGIPRTMMTGWKTWPCLALEIRATHVFEQTPGPGTGELLT
jgi:hypothetical protein